MKPSQVSIAVRRIAAYIISSQNPSLSKVTRELRRIADQLTPEELDVHNIMERGVPRGWPSGRNIIKSNYQLADADIYYSYDVNVYNEYDKLEKHPDTMETQKELVEPSANVTALIIWPDADLLVDFGHKGSAHSSEGHLLDQSGKVVKDKRGFSESFSSSDVDLDNFSQILAVAGPESNITNAQLLDLKRQHGYR